MFMMSYVSEGTAAVQQQMMQRCNSQLVHTTQCPYQPPSGDSRLSTFRAMSDCQSSQPCCQQLLFSASWIQVRFLTVSIFDQCYTAGNMHTAYCIQCRIVGFITAAVVGTCNIFLKCACYLIGLICQCAYYVSS